MFASSLYNVLVNDTILTNYVSTFDKTQTGSVPSIFKNSAPENIEFPYIVFRIYGTGGEDSSVDTFNVMIDIFDYGESGKDAILIERRIVELLDRMHLDHSYYDTIRFFRRGADFVEANKNPRAIQYNIRFRARAGRSGWMQQF